MYTVLDIENTVTKEGWEEGKSLLHGDASPYNPSNELVMVQFKVGGEERGEVAWFHHNKVSTDAAHSAQRVQDVLDKTTLLVGHNLKHDLSWLWQCGFTYDGDVWDTMIFEYLQARGLKPSLKLGDCAERRQCTHEKTDFMKDNLKAGINVDDMLPEGLEEYGLADIYTTEELYQKQLELTLNDTDSKRLMPAAELMNDFLPVLADIEGCGCQIDIEELDRLDREYNTEKRQLQEDLQIMVQDVMGDTPYNLASPEQLSQIIYGFKLTDKTRWAQEFGIGTELRNGVRKKKYQRRLSDNAVSRVMRETTELLYKTEASRCDTCYGRGKYYKKKKDGTDYAKPHTCKDCDGVGVKYTPTDKRAGFCLKHPGSFYATANGFATSKGAIELLVDRAKQKSRLSAKGESAVVFLTKLQRLSAVETYINSFIGGIRKGLRGDILHPTYNQCVTATGRLSSTNPNSQNYPRSNTFPIKKVFVSRFKGGKIMSCDLAQLEFRVAAFLSQCQKTIDFIHAGNDIHLISAEHFGVSRQEAKASSFRPLYGGLDDWTEEFYKNFPGIRKWHKELGEEALANKQIVAPSGRIYAFPYARRASDKYGRPIVQPATQIYNYPVQGFATADIMPAICVQLWRSMKAANTKSKLILTVHDDVTADVHPDEIEIMAGIFRSTFDGIYDECKRRFGVDINVEIGYDLEIGDNWMELETMEKI